MKKDNFHVPLYRILSSGVVETGQKLINAMDVWKRFYYKQYIILADVY